MPNTNTKTKKRSRHEERSSSLPPDFGPPPSAKRAHRKHNSSSQQTAPAASTSQARNRSNRYRNNNSNTTTSSAVASTRPTNPPTFVQPHVLTNGQKNFLNNLVDSLDLSDEAHKRVLKVCEDTQPENRFIATMASLARIQETVEEGLANQAADPESAAIAIWKPSDVLKKYITSKDTQFVKAHYPPGYGTPDGAAAYKLVNDWANTMETNTRSCLRNILLTNIKPAGKIKPTHPMPTLKRLISLVHHAFILQTDPRTDDQLFVSASKDLKLRIAFLRLHAVHTYRRPSTDHKYCVWNSVDDTLEALKSNRKKHGKLYKDA
ncbi:hypothetical protein DFH28DRAFT_884042 [Melampsora americana]|nr:hypothetical protein DFH28DRAFT_884042 [Melampsora americana]